MVLLTPTPRHLSAITAYNALPITKTPLTPPLTHHQLLTLSRTLRSHHPSDDYSFTTLLRGTSIHTPSPPPPPPKTPEYKALMSRLRAQQEEREYHLLLSSSATPEDASEEMTWKEVKSQVSVILNILFSVFATAAAVWKVAGSWDVPARLAAAFVSALLVAVAETVLYGGYVRRLEEARRKEGRRKEVKRDAGVRWVVDREGVKEKEG